MDEPEPEVAIVHDPGGLGFRIERITAYLAVHDDDDEGVVGAPIGGAMMPMVAADDARVADLDRLARELAPLFGKPIRKVRFETRTELEVFEP